MYPTRYEGLIFACGDDGAAPAIDPINPDLNFNGRPRYLPCWLHVFSPLWIALDTSSRARTRFSVRGSRITTSEPTTTIRSTRIVVRRSIILDDHCIRANYFGLRRPANAENYLRDRRAKQLPHRWKRTDRLARGKGSKDKVRGIQSAF